MPQTELGSRAPASGIAPPTTGAVPARREPDGSRLRDAGVRRPFHDLLVRPPGQVPALDALRSLAILLVIAGHFSGAKSSGVGTPMTPWQRLPIFTHGWVGVDLFFVLSGLLIGQQLWREFAREGTVDVGRFLVRRGLRIWPLYFGVMLIAIAVVPGATMTWADWTFLSNYVAGNFPGGWSLSTEEHFYIAIPLLIVGLRRWVGIQGWVVGVPLLIGLVALARTQAVSELRALGIDEGGIAQRLQYQFHLHCEGLLAGLLIALVMARHPAWFRPAQQPRFHWKGALAGLGLVLLGLALHRVDQRVFTFLALACVFGGLTTWLLVDTSIWSRPARAWVFYPISRLSYGIYVNHLYLQVLLGATLMPLLRRQLGDGTPTFFVGLGLSFVVYVAAAVVTFYAIERPFLRLRDRWLGHGRPLLPGRDAGAGVPYPTPEIAGAVTDRI